MKSSPSFPIQSNTLHFETSCSFEVNKKVSSLLKPLIISELPSPSISLNQSPPSDQRSKELIHFAFDKNYNESCVDSFNHFDTHDNNQIYDFIHKKCYNIRCGFLYKNEGGECVKRNVSLSHLSSDGRCYLKTLKQWELQGVVVTEAPVGAGKSHAFPVEIGFLDVMPAPSPSVSVSSSVFSLFWFVPRRLRPLSLST